jgi:LPS-assembly protein
MDEAVFRSRGVARGRLLPGRPALALVLAIPLLALAFTTFLPESATAAQAGAAARNPDKLYIDADQLIYDKDRNIVTAVGSVVLYYKNRVLQADRVVYDRKNKRIHAEGRVKLTDEKGDVTYAPRFDLTEDFASGFADSVQELTTDKTRFTSTRVERSAGSITVLDQGVYTACEPCKAHPERPPQWQVRAARIIENQQTHTVYFENAWLVVYGVPILYLPYLSAPDPTVTRKTGLLTPTYVNGSGLGSGVSVPYFFAPAPNYDLTLIPSYYSLQGPAGDMIWRHRLETGEYSIRLSGIDEMRPSEFLPAPYGAGNVSFRGSAETQGKFYINDKWNFGWDFTYLSDRFYLHDYRLSSFDPTQYFFQDIVSSAYLRGQSGRGFFDFSLLHFQTTSAFVDQRQEPSIVPTLDYHRTFPVDPDQSHGLGGEATVTLNAASVNRTEALYQAVGAEQFDKAYNLYSTCATYTPGTTSSNCLLRGVAGDYSRASAELSWQRKIVDPVGEVWTPFVFGRVTGESTSLETSQTFSYGVSAIPNSAQPAFFNGASSGSAVTGMPGIGLEYRFPFTSTTSFGQQVVEPIAQIIARPNEIIPRIQPNEDAQSLVFDDTNLFAWNKYSGFDRIEGGTRANYGLQYTSNFANGGHANIVGGESIQLAGQNSYTIADAANTGLESGLDKQFSNYVAGETLQPFSAPFSLTSKQQFDSSDFELRRFDGIVSAKVGDLNASIDYGRYAAQPELGWLYPREGVTASGSYKFQNGVTASGALTLDMSRHYFDTPGTSTPLFYPTFYQFGLAYATDCTTFKLSYTSTYSEPISTTPGVPAPPGIRDQSLLFEIDLRTLGDIKGSTGVN